MLVPITINHQDLRDQYTISEQGIEMVIDFTIKEITAAFAEAWANQAKQDLKSTRERYINNLRVVDEGRMSGAVILDYSKDPIVPMLEEGASAFDQKEGFAKSSKKKFKKNGGWYLTIPFSVGSPGVVESSTFSNVLPKPVYDIVKAKPVSPVTGRTVGLGKNEIPQEYSIPKTRAAVTIPESKTFNEYKHKASVNQGVYRKEDATTGQSSYGSFRRVSDKSDENSWVFPGITAYNLAEKAFAGFETRVEPILESSLNSALSYFGID